MNKKLMDLRKRFASQRTAVIENTGYGTGENRFRHVTPGKHTCIAVVSKLQDGKEGTSREGQYNHAMYLEVQSDGEDGGAWLSPYQPDLNVVDGIISCASNVQRVLSDVVPGSADGNGNFVIDIPKFLAIVEDLVGEIQGQYVEVTVKDNLKSQSRRDDGTPYQNVYINRGLGDDVQAFKKTQRSTPPVRQTTGRAVTKKKVVRKKRR